MNWCAVIKLNEFNLIKLISVGSLRRLERDRESICYKVSSEELARICWKVSKLVESFSATERLEAINADSPNLVDSLVGVSFRSPTVVWYLNEIDERI